MMSWNDDTNEETMKQKKEERPTLNAQRPTPNAGSVAMIAIDELTEHPDALAFWPDSRARHEDIEAICDSIVEAGGVGEPLTVCRRADGGWWVIDGCTRLKGARRAALNAVPCLAVDIRDDQIKDEVFMRNMTRTRFGTGMRIMRYLEKHHDQVLAAAIVNADPAKSGALGGRGKKAESRDTGFSSGAIAERLKVSDKDVRAAIELLRCRAEGRIVDAADGTRTLRKATDEEREGVEEAYRRVLDGTPPRRWLPAAKGHTATNDKAKAEPRWHEVARRAFVSVQNAFAHLSEMDSGLRAKVIAEWADTAKVVGKHIGNMGAQP